MNKTAIVTGGSGGIGVACAEVLVARGYDVVLTARRPEPLRVAAAKVGARWVAADAADEVAFAGVVADLERVDLLVHAAGILAGTFVRKEHVATFDDVLRANLRSTFVTTSAVLPKMPVGGRIIYISSTAGRHGMKGRSAYSASKAGMNAFAEALADEVARDGINVNVLTVAPVETDMLEKVTFPMHTLQAIDVANAVGFLDALDPSVVVPDILLRAADEGPLAPDPVTPESFGSTSGRDG
ncbi:MAG: SDR family oxidoreductase [Actinomycetota bacterium]|nr:SDR family oxidoreductase [Actinomycetota bacterium]